jgi:protein involved in polysaccharide export with SLBB domain
MKIILILIITTLSIFAQFSGSSSMKDLFMEDQLESLKSMDNIVDKSIPYSRRVDPKLYKCGPGDVFLFKVMPYSTKDEQIIVDPEGKLILPRNYGAFDAYNKSIFELRKEIQEKLEKDENSIVFSLMKPRSVIIKIEGDIKSPGLKTLPANFTIEDVVNRFQKIEDSRVLSELSTMNMMNDYINDKFKNEINKNNFYPSHNIFATRNIVVRNSGVTKIYDIAGAEFKDASQNPFIREGDNILIPKMEKQKNYYSVVGAVNKPSKIAHINNDDVNLAINLAGGLSYNCDLEKSHIISKDGTKVKLKFDDNNLVTNYTNEIKSGSTVIIAYKNQEDTKNGIISISGEVYKPENLVIIDGETKLSEILKESGVKESACLNLAKIYNFNDYVNKDLALDLETMEHLQYFDLTVEDTTLINMEYRFRKPRVSVDFEDVINGNTDVLLRDGDIIELPECPTRIQVLGRVNQPGFVEFVADKHPEWYVNSAGGFSKSADESRLRVIRGNTGVWEEVNRNTIVRPGDLIYSPSEPLVSEINQTQQYAAIGAILGAIGAIALTLVQVYNITTR